jgi:hypothetical protein
MRTIVLFAIMVLALIAWFVSSMAVERHRELTIVNADYPVCVTIRNGPLLGPVPTDKNPYPRRNDSA